MGNAVSVDHWEMDAAFCRGAAVPLDASVSWLVWYRDAWWVVYPDGWLKVTDELAVGDIGPDPGSVA
ncbi:MAG TPA: hypothetical protein VGG16_22955 [Streptosporangiaceae bacterium]|jgi:hypothetical protein